MDSQPKPSSTFDRTFNYAGILFTIVGVVVATYFTVRPPAQRQVEFRYLGKLSLFNLQPLVPEAKVVFQGKEVSNITKVQVKYTNSGNAPIRTEDVERFPEVSFAPAHVLRAQVVSKEPADMTADCEVTDDKVTIRHRLMNPGDSVMMEVTCDGDPGWPKPTIRIADVKEPGFATPGEPSAKYRAAFFEVGAGGLYAILTCASVGAFVSLLLSLVLLGVTATGIVRTTPTRLRKIVDDVFADMDPSTFDSDKLSSQLFIRLPGPIDSRVQRAIAKADRITGEAPSAAGARLKNLVLAETDKCARLSQRVDPDLLVITTISIAVCVPIALVIAGAWRGVAIGI